MSRPGAGGVFEDIIGGLRPLLILIAFGFAPSEFHAIDLGLLGGLILRRAFPDSFQVDHVTHARSLPFIAYADCRIAAWGRDASTHA